MRRKRFIKLIMSKPGYERKHAVNRAENFLSTKRFCEFMYAHRDISPMKPRMPHELTYQRYWDLYEKPEGEIRKKRRLRK